MSEGAGERERSPASARMPLAVTIRVSLFLAVLTGLFEVLIRPQLPIDFGSFSRHPTYFVWIAPASVLAGYLVLVPIVVVLGLLIRPLSTRRAVLTLLLFPLSATVAATFLRRIEGWALVILALGLASVLQRLWSLLERRLRFWPLLGRIGFVAMIVAIGWGFLAVRARHELPPPAAAAAEGAPNVILVTLDTLRAPSMSLYGYERDTTPELRKLADEAVVFDRAYSTTSWTLPSHASIFTGLWAHQTRSDFTAPLPEGAPTLAEIFRGRGYDTAGFVANVVYCTTRSGLARGFAHYEDQDLSLHTLLVCTTVGRLLDRFVRGFDSAVDYPGRRDAEALSADFLSWLDRREGGRPFFAFLNYFDVHQPYETPEPFDSMYDRRDEGEDGRAVIRLAAKGEERHLDDMDRYDGAIRYLDRELGRLVAELRRRGLLERTILVVTSDHGETFAEHVPTGHSASLYVETVHVPLLVSGPGIPRGLRLDREVSLRDLGRTILDLVDPAGAAASDFPGVAIPLDAEATAAVSPRYGQLSRGVRLAPDARNFAGAVLSLIRDDLHLIVHRDPRLGDELYDLARDPFERDNLVDDEAYRERLEALRAEFRVVSEKAR